MNSKTKPFRVNQMTRQRALKPRPSQLIRANVEKINKGLPEVSKRPSNASNSDSDERLVIDVEDSRQSSICSNSSEDEAIGSEDFSIDKIKTERVRNWWAKNFSQKKGDPSKVVEITLSDDEEDEVPLKQDSKEKSSDKSMVKVKRFVSYNKISKKCDDFCEPFSGIKDTNDIKQSLKLKELSLYDKKKKLEQLIDLKNYYKDIKKDFYKHLNESQTIITKTKSSEKFFCFLCPELCETSEEAKTHYLNHLGVCLECGECHQKFTSIQSYRKHNSQHLDRNKMLYLDEFMTAKKWSHHFVDYIEHHLEELTKQYCHTIKMFCPVCRKIDEFSDNKKNSYKLFEKSMKSSKLKFDEEFILNHLHQHFQYFPFECIDCRFEDKKTEFCLNRTARQHLLDVHNIENAFDLKTNELKTYFDPKKSIKKLDFYLEYCLSLSLQMSDYWIKSSQKCDKSKIFQLKC